MTIPASALLAAATNSAQEFVGETTYEFSTLRQLAEQPWLSLVLIACSLLAAGLVITIYRRDTRELKPVIGLVLLITRLTVLAILLFFFLRLEKRTTRELVVNSRVLMLVDTSQSMGLHDNDSSAVPATPSRIDQITAHFADGKLFAELRKAHDVVVERFDREMAPVVSFNKQTPQIDEPPPSASSETVSSPSSAADWKQALRPQGSESRIGSAIKQLVERERSTPVSGIILLTDGAQNSGLDPTAATTAAREAGIPIYPIGLGSDYIPQNVRVSDIIAPTRVFPGDTFHITAYLQSYGLANRTVTVELLSRAAAAPQGPNTLEDSLRATLTADGQVTPVRFELSSDQAGRRTYRVQVASPPEDRDMTDNAQEADIETIERKSRVLLLAGAASREYQFLCSQLRRDRSFTVDVLLQSARPGISQDADNILGEFPSTKEALYAYDAVIAFDPDWTRLSQTQVDLLEQWVAEQAGGLIAVAGPIHMDQWAKNSAMSKIRALYPVEISRRFSLLSDANFGAAQPWPLEFTEAGNNAEFLLLDDTLEASREAWQRFSGVYGFYSVQGAKPGATIYARFSNPEASVTAELPVYMAGHFYGSGRVLYLGSGEMWRLRSVDDAHFERLYTQLIRHASQGRLQRGSSRGLLLVERDRYLLGSNVVVRAQLSNLQHEPLDREYVTLQVTQPDSTSLSVRLKPDHGRTGLYTGQFTVFQEGAFRLDLPIPDSADEHLSRRIQVRVPDLERENPQRNDALLRTVATQSGGRYYIGLDSTLGHSGLPPLANLLRDRQETTTLSGTPDKDFEKLLMQCTMGALCSLLFLEWLIRRLCKLA